jgi:hypothetical protein
MADLLLHDSQTDADDLPKLCMICGHAATAHSRHHFMWLPVRARIFGNDFSRARARQYMWMDIPICDSHHGYFWKRAVIIYLPQFLLMATCLIAALLLQQIGEKSSIAWVLGAFGGGAIGCMVWAVIMRHRSLRPKEITPSSITLANVHDDFVAAYAQMKKTGQRHR